MRNLLPLPLLLLLLAGAPAHAAGGNGHGGHGGASQGGASQGDTEQTDGENGEHARAAVRAGKIRPLAELMAIAESRYGGRVIATHLERNGGLWIYEMRLLPPSGRMFEVRINAATGAVTGTRGLPHSRGKEQDDR